MSETHPLDFKQIHYDYHKLNHNCIHINLTEYFFVFQVISNRDTQETLLCIAFVFEVSTSEHGAQHHIYRLVKD